MKNKLYSVLAVLVLITTGLQVKAQSHTCDLGCSPTTFAVRAYGTSMFSDLKSDKYSGEETKKYGYNVGADAMWYFLNKGKFKVNLSIGASVTDYHVVRWLNYSNNYTTIDVDGQTVNVKELATNFNENQNYRTIDIPVKLGFEYSVAQALDVFLNVGCSYGFVWDESYTNYATMTRTGYYPVYNVLIYDTPYPPYYYPQAAAASGNGMFAHVNNISAEATLGLKVKINTLFSITCGVKSLMGLKNIKNNESNPSLLDNNYALTSLAVRDDKVTTWGLGLELGLSMNLGTCPKAAHSK